MEIKKFLHKARRRLFFLSLITIETTCLIIGFAMTAILQTAACVTPVAYADEWSVLCLGVAAFIGLVLSFVRLPSNREAARRVDETGLRERVSTAFENMGKEGGLYSLQRDDAVLHVKRFSFRERMPITVHRWLTLCLFATVLFSVGARLFPTTSKEMAREKRKMTLEIKKDEEMIKKVWEKVKQDDAVSMETKERWEEWMKEAVEELSQAETMEELSKSKERLNKKLEQEFEKNGSDGEKEELADYRKSMNLSELTRFENDLDRLSRTEEELDRVKEDVVKLASGLSQQQREALLEQLRKAADDGSLNAEELAEALEGLNHMNADANASINQQGTNGQNPEDQGEEGQGSNGQSSKSQGTQGQGSGTQGTGGQGMGNQGSGGSGSGTGGGWNNGSKVGVEKQITGLEKKEEVTIPDRESGNDENLTGKSSEGESKRTKGDSPLAWEGRRVDYTGVMGEYGDRAYAKIEGGKVPSEMSDVVKSYFDALKP